MLEQASQSFAAMLRQYRLAAGLTQAQLAERAGLSSRGISDLERGARRLPRRDTLALLMVALQLSVRERGQFEAAAHALTARDTGAPRLTPRGRPSRQVRLAALAAPAPAGTGAPMSPLVGRVAELRLLDRHLAGDGPPVLLLVGEPGIGKTRLLQEVEGRAAQAGWTLLSGGCSRGGGQEPYAPLLEALERHLHAQTLPRLRTHLRGCAWLVRLLPELAEGPIESLPAWTLPPEQERRLMFRAVQHYLANVAGSTGTLLVLDDLQWAGADALALLETLLRAAVSPLRVVGAYRDTEAQRAGPLASWLADLARTGVVARHTVRPLGADAAALLELLLEGAPPDLRVDRGQVLQRAGGVPFFLHSFAQALRQGGAVTVPWDLAEGVRQRMAALPATAREVVSHAAVIGRVAERSVLLAMAGQARVVVLDALTAACRARLLAEEGPAAYRFTHDVVREVVEGDLSAGERAALHQRVAEALEALPGVASVEALAYHYARSDAPEKAMPYLEQAGDRAWAQHANAVAADYYGQLVAQLDRLGRTLDAARAREKLGEALATMARHISALEALEQAADALLAAGDLERAGQVTGRIAHIHYIRGTHDEGIARLQPFLERLEARGPSVALAMLYTSLAELSLISGRCIEDLDMAERAVLIARLVGDDAALARAELIRTDALDLIARARDAEQACETAIRLAESVHDLSCLVNALHGMAILCEETGELERTRHCVERGLMAAEQLGNPVLIATSHVRVGAGAFFRGDWGQAHAAYARAEAIYRQMEFDPTSPCDYGGLLLDLGRFRLAQGDWEAASRYLEESRSIFADNGKRVALRVAQRLLAELDILRGHPEAALPRLIPLLDRASLQEHYVTTQVYPALAWAHVELGDREQAAQVLEDGTRRARAQGYRLGLADLLRVQALFALHQGQRDAVERAVQEGLALSRALPYPYGEARLLQAYGESHIWQHDVAAAREQFEAALAIFQRLGACKDIERTKRLLATLG